MTLNLSLRKPFYPRHVFRRTIFPIQIMLSKQGNYKLYGLETYSLYIQCKYCNLALITTDIPTLTTEVLPDYDSDPDYNPPDGNNTDTERIQL